MSCGVGCRHSLDLMLLWLWCRLAGVAPIGPLAWEPPHAMGEALKSKNIKIKIKLCQEFLLWCNGIGSISGTLGLRFDTWPSTVG